MSGTGYDLSTAMYSQDGRIFQIEYAQKAIDGEETFIGLKTSDGVVLACEKIQKSALEAPEGNKRIFVLEGGISLGISGRLPDGRLLVDRAKKECKSYRKNFGRVIPVPLLAERVANYIHYHTVYAQLRPLGCSVFIAAHQEGKHFLYMVENTGIFRAYKGATSGKGRQIARNKLEKAEKLTGIAEGKKLAALAITAAHEEFKEKTYEIEMTTIAKENNNRHCIVPAEECCALRLEAEELLDE